MSDQTSLKTILALKPSALYPGHGPHISSFEICTSHVQNYLSHRQEREDQIISLLQSIADDPTLLIKSLSDLEEKRGKDKAAVDKYNHEFLSGKPYEPSEEKEKKVEEAKEKEDKVIDKFPESSTAITVPLICRLLYKTDKDQIIFAAGKSVSAHLVKLEKERKVRRFTVSLPKMANGIITEPVQQEGWEWAGEEEGDEVEDREAD